MNILLGLFIPFFGTALGSATVLILKNKLNNKIEKFMLGFASGVMIAASIWSLIIPSIEMAEITDTLSWFPAAIGFTLGVLFLLLLDYIVPHLHNSAKKSEGPESNLSQNTKLWLAVTLHNIPEGMAIGVIFSGILNSTGTVTISGAFALAIGIAIQNFPEGAIISLPLKEKGMNKFKAFIYGVLSGIVEPIAAIITIMFTNFINPLLPYILSFAAGAMIFVVVEELIPDAQSKDHSNLSVIGVTLGFVLMMILDVGLK